VSDTVDTINTDITDCRTALLAGSRNVPLTLGLSARALHIERGERECFGTALSDIAQALGPAARLIEIGPFAGLIMGQLLAAMERPKAGVIINSNLDARLFARLQETDSTAEITLLRHVGFGESWPLDSVGAGKTIICAAGGGFGLMTSQQAFSVLDQASQTLLQGDFVALTLDMPRDSAVVDVIYRDFGNQLVNQALNALGRADGFEARTFFDAATQRVRFGALTAGRGSIAWNGTVCPFQAGSWLDFGGMQLHTHDSLVDMHPDFAVHLQWQSQDQSVLLLLLRKI
jgi:hypothetical protein